MQTKSVLKALAYLIESDFKTVKKKFLDQEVEKEAVDEYIDLFKKFKDGNRITKSEDKNIDNWGKKSFEEFKEFLDELKETKSKTQIKKLKKMEGAELVAENEDWYVYKITTKDAVIFYGSGTKWCITNKGEKWFEKYSKRNDFYFYISKNREKGDRWYKIALQVNRNGNMTYWDAEDKDHKKSDGPKSLPGNLNLPEFKVTLDAKELTKLEEIAGDIEDEYELRDDYYREDEDNHIAEHVGSINLSGISSDWEQHLTSSAEDMIEYLEDDLNLDKDDIKELLLEISIVKVSERYNQDNELYGVIVGEQTEEVGEDLHKRINELSNEEKEEVRNLISNDIYIDADLVTYSVGDDYTRWILYFEDDALRNKIDEVKEEKRVNELEESEETITDLEKVALDSPHEKARLAAINRINNQDIIEKVAIDDKNPTVRLAAIKKMENEDKLKEVAENNEENNHQRTIALEKIEDQEFLKQIVIESTKELDTEDILKWGVTQVETAFNKITDKEFIKKYGLLNRLVKKNAAELIDDPSYLKKLLNKELEGKKDEEYYSTELVKTIVEKLPATEQALFEQIAKIPYGRNHWDTGKLQIEAIRRITNKNVLKDILFNLEEKGSRYEGPKFKMAAIEGLKDYKKIMRKVLMSKDMHKDLKKIALKNVTEDVAKSFYKGLTNSDIRTNYADELMEVIKDQNILKDMISKIDDTSKVLVKIKDDKWIKEFLNDRRINEKNDYVQTITWLKYLEDLVDIKRGYEILQFEVDRLKEAEKKFEEESEEDTKKLYKQTKLERKDGLKHSLERIYKIQQELERDLS